MRGAPAADAHVRARTHTLARVHVSPNLCAPLADTVHRAGVVPAIRSFAEGELRSSIHTEKYNHREKSHKVGTLSKKSAHARFHTYSLEWTPTKIAIFVDNQCTLTYARKDEGGVHDPKVWPFDQRFHLVLNVAIGGHWAGQQGIDDSLFPISLEIAYVRVYQRPERATSPIAGRRIPEGEQPPKLPRAQGSSEIPALSAGTVTGAPVTAQHALEPHQLGTKGSDGHV